MPKTVMNFTVIGSSREELFEKAKALYNEFNETQDKDLPHSTVIDVQPAELQMDSGVNSWQGTVHLSDPLRIVR